MCEVAFFKNFENRLTTAKVMTKTKVAPFYVGHGVVSLKLKYNHGTTEYRGIFHGTYRGAKSVVLCNTTVNNI